MEMLVLEGTNARRFLRDLERAAPMKITRVLTDNVLRGREIWKRGREVPSRGTFSARAAA
jgi:hypothetical protein